MTTWLESAYAVLAESEEQVAKWKEMLNEINLPDGVTYVRDLILSGDFPVPNPGDIYKAERFEGPRDVWVVSEPTKLGAQVHGTSTVAFVDFDVIIFDPITKEPSRTSQRIYWISEDWLADPVSYRERFERAIIRVNPPQK